VINVEARLFDRREWVSLVCALESRSSELGEIPSLVLSSSLFHQPVDKASAARYPWRGTNTTMS